MCGVAAVYARGVRLPDERTLRRIVARQTHRGPDNVQVVAHPRCLLGFNRLRISDPRPEADQPFTSDDGQVSLLLNGEVFNHLELREPLLRAGARFRTTSDAETVLQLYLRYGADMLAKLEGQFAICIYDQRRGRLLLARDGLGICPLYFVEHQGVVHVASSVEALLSAIPGVAWELDSEALGEYLLLRFVLAPRTLIRQIRQVRPAEVLTYEDGGQRTRRYWQVGSLQPGAHGALEEALRERLIESVRSTATSDVPIGAFLSGGLDSSIVVAAVSRTRGTPLETLSIHLGEHSEEETAHALLAARAFGCNHQVYRVNGRDMSALAAGCLAAMDHPTGARDAVAAFALARRLKQQRPSIKAVLTGTGADELFAGYSSAYFRPRSASLEEQCSAYVKAYSCTTPRAWRALSEVVRGPLPVKKAAAEIELRMRQLHPALPADDATNVLCAFYLVCHLPGWELPVQDTMCMAASLEPRVPYLGRRVVELAMGISGARKLEAGREKAVLRDAFAGVLPEELRARPKLPLSRPVSEWLCQHGVRDLYRSVRFRDRGIFHLDRLQRADTLAEFDVMWRIMALECWLQRNLD
jgi:asparagine synthase (glutamine-hydrolysing)